MKSMRVSGMLLFLFAFVIVLCLYFNFVFIPLSDKISELDAQHARDSIQIQEYDVQFAEIGTLRDKVADLNEKLTLAQKNSFVQADATADDVDTAFLTNAIQPQSITIGGVEVDPSGVASSTGQPLSKLSVTMSFQSDTDGMLRMVDYFENQSKGSYYVQSVSHSAGESGALSVNLTIALYFFPQAEATS